MNKATVFAALVGGLLMSSASVMAQDASAPAAAPAAAPMQAAPQDDPNEIICHAGEPILGSRFPGPRTCHTRKEWDQIRRDSQDALYHQQMERSANGGH
jgi:Spy/CpxP family protein refolding chaperone